MARAEYYPAAGGWAQAPVRLVGWPPSRGDAMAEPRDPAWVYNETVRMFAIGGDPPHEDPAELEASWGRAWGLSNDVGRIRSMHRTQAPLQSSRHLHMVSTPAESTEHQTRAPASSATCRSAWFISHCIARRG